MTPSTSPENDLTAAEGDPSAGAPDAVTPVEGQQPLPADIAELSYEAARDRLTVEVVRRLESGRGRARGLDRAVGARRDARAPLPAVAGRRS